MKKLMLMFLAIAGLCLVLGVASHELSRNQGAGNQEKTLNLYNWGDYIDPKLITKFEHQTGYHVNYETFDSNEAMFTKIKQGGTAYDLAVPSDYMIAKMKKAHLLEHINHHDLSNYRYLNKRFLNQSFDRGNQYSVPYFWGTLGIIYNDKFVKPQEMKHWRDLWNPKWRDSILLVDSARDIMGMALVTMGQSMNTTNRQTLLAARQRLDQLSPNVKAIIADEIKVYMAQNEAPLAVSWSGEASEMLSENHHLHYVVPQEGSNLWFDNMVIPKTARHKKAALAFINFMLNPVNAAQNAEYVGYATPNQGALAKLPAKVRKDAQFYPDDTTLRHLQVYDDLAPKAVQEYNDLFLDFKMYRQ